MIKSYLQSGQNEKAVALAKENYYLDKSKDDIWDEYVKVASNVDKKLFDELVNEAIRENDTQKVVDLLEENIEKKPDDVQTIVSLSAFYYKAGDKDSSLKVLDEAIEKFHQFKTQLLKIRQDVEKGNIR